MGVVWRPKDLDAERLQVIKIHLNLFDYNFSFFVKVAGAAPANKPRTAGRGEPDRWSPEVGATRTMWHPEPVGSRCDLRQQATMKKEASNKEKLLVETHQSLDISSNAFGCNPF